MVQEPQKTTCCPSLRLSDGLFSQHVVRTGSTTFPPTGLALMWVNVRQTKLHSELEYRRVGLRSEFKIRITPGLDVRARIISITLASRIFMLYYDNAPTAIIQIDLSFENSPNQLSHRLALPSPSTHIVHDTPVPGPAAFEHMMVEVDTCHCWAVNIQHRTMMRSLVEHYSGTTRRAEGSHAGYPQRYARTYRSKDALGAGRNQA